MLFCEMRVQRYEEKLRIKSEEIISTLNYLTLFNYFTSLITLFDDK